MITNTLMRIKIIIIMYRIRLVLFGLLSDDLLGCVSECC